MEQKQLKVIEIFGSIDGEGRRAGELTTFIRLSGCNLRCSWCDTAYSQDANCGNLMTIDDILEQVFNIGYKNITVTGGEPLIHNNIYELLLKLVDNGYDVNVETNGSVDPNYLIKSPEFNDKGGDLWFTIDYKSKSSGMQYAMNLNHFVNLRKKDVIKFVVGSREELEDAFNILMKLEPYFLEDEDNVPLVYFSPVFGMIEPVEIVDFMKEHKLTKNVRVQLQLHKIIWDPNKRGV